MLFGLHDESDPTSKKEEILMTIVAVQNARIFLDEARDALLGNDEDSREKLWSIRKELREVIKDLQHEYKKSCKSH